MLEERCQAFAQGRVKIVVLDLARSDANTEPNHALLYVSLNRLPLMVDRRTLNATHLHLGFLSEIAIRNRSHIGCDWGHKWGQPQ